MTTLEKLYSPQFLAELADVKPVTVLDWIRKGRIRATKMPGGRQYRISESEVLRIIEGGTVEGNN